MIADVRPLATAIARNVPVTTPDASYNTLFNRGLLATALHVDAAKGGIIAGFHNGAYPYCWPRDAVLPSR